MNINTTLAKEFSLRQDYADNLVELLNEGNTIPFIARYRKEMHGELDDQTIREFADRLTYLTNLLNRKAEVEKSIKEQEKWTDELAVALTNAKTMTEVEDIYRPYKQKKKTRATVAVERGLQPLADIIFAQELKKADLTALASDYINEEKQILTTDDALAGANDIIAEIISDNAELRKILREMLWNNSTLNAVINEKAEKEKSQVYDTYNGFSQLVKLVPPHRTLAINRGEKEDCLKVSIDENTELAQNLIEKKILKASAFDDFIKNAIADSYHRLIFPSIEREVRNQLTEDASEQAIKMFDNNLRPLLMQPPLKGKIILGLDPGYRTGCKVAVIDQNGNVLDHNVIFPTHDNRVPEAEKIVATMIAKHKVQVISIGNGTASKETEIFVVNLLKKIPVKVQYIITNEAGASVYSASKLGAEEFPEYDLTIRSAISIARRLQDPLAELIKIDVKSLGVGQYQHDMPQKRLTSVLEGVVEDCVNSVGVDLNTASHSLLAYISGLNSATAKNIVEYRKITPFISRQQLLEVPKLGKKAFEQCAGFLRVLDGKDVLDNTAVHPESYKTARLLLKKFNYTDSDVVENKLNIEQDIETYGADKLAKELEVGVPTLKDIAKELAKPGRDIRDSLPKPILRAELLELKNLKVGMELTGVVRNVIDFGAFVDIGVHQDGLVHLSEMSDNYISHPSEVLKVGDNVNVRVIAVDVDKNRIGLSMRDPNAKKPEKSDRPKGNNTNSQRNKNFNNQKPPQANKENLENSLEKLMAKYGGNTNKKR